MADVEVHPIQIGGAGDLSGTIVLFCGHQDAWLSAMKHVQTAAGSLKGALNIPFAQYYRGLAASSAYAVLLDTTVEGDAPDLTVLQLGTRPKVLGTARLPGFTIRKGCSAYIAQTGSSIAVTQRSAPGGITVLSVHLNVACAVNLKPACSDELASAAYQGVGKQLSVWSWTVSVKVGRLNTPRQGPSAVLVSDRCLHKMPRGLGVVNGIVYATYSYGTAPKKEVTNGFGIFKLLPGKTAKGVATAKLVNTHRFNTFGFAAVPTGPTSAISAHLQICSYAKGRGKWCGGPYLPPGAYYQSIAARGGDAYALVTYTQTTALDTVFANVEVMKISAAALRAGQRGTMLLSPDNSFRYFSLAVVP